MKINWDDDLVKKLEEAEKVHLECVATAEKVLELLANHTETGLTKKEISARAKARKQRVIRNLKKLVEIKSLIRVGKGTKGDPYRYLYCKDLQKSR